jgi:hypothetical protein
VAAGLVVSTYFAVLRIAEHKADVLAGGGTFPLDQSHPREMATFRALLDRLRSWGETDLAGSLVALQESGRLWAAPRLGGDRSAIYVSALGLVARVYVRRDELVAGRVVFPDLEVPDAARRTFATVNLAGTLYHELQHEQGLEDEGLTYDQEIDWYRRLEQANIDRLHGEDRRWFEWALASALQSARAARAEAVRGEGGGPPS